MAEGGAPGRASKVRQRFSGFYDLKLRQDNEHDIDSTNFNSESYVGSMLSNKSLPELVQKSNDLSLEIKELESDMQMLVYENYNKFISATETIQDMKMKVDGMEGEMGRLSKSVSEITESSSRINENLSDRRMRIQKLNGVRRLLKKLSFIFELPTRLKRTVELDAGAEAVKYWRTALPVLRAYRHVPSFRAVETEATAILQELKEKLRARLQSRDVPAAEAQEAALLLIQLGEPCRPIRKEFVALFSSRLRLPAALQSLAQHKQQQRGHAGGANAGARCMLGQADGPLSCEFVNGAKSMILGYQMLLPGASPLTHAATDAAGGAAEGAAGAADAKEEEEDAKQLVRVVEDVFKEYLAVLRAAVCDADGSEDISLLLPQLERWLDGMRGVESLLHVLPQVSSSSSLHGAADEMAAAALTGRVTAAFRDVAAKWTDSLVMLAAAATPAARASWQASVDTAYGAGVSAMQAGVNAVRPLFVARSPLLNAASAALVAALSKHVAELVDACLGADYVEGVGKAAAAAAGGGAAWVGSVDKRAAASGEFALLMLCWWTRMLHEGLALMGSWLHAIDKTRGGLEVLQQRLAVLIRTLRHRYLSVRTAAIGAQVQSILAASNKGEALPFVAAPTGLGDALAKAIKEASGELRCLYPMHAVKVERETDLGYGAGMRASHVLELSRQDVEDVAADGREAAALLRALVLQGLNSALEHIRGCSFSQKDVQYVEAQMEVLKQGLADVSGVSLDISVSCLISEINDEAASRCVQ